MQCSRKDGAISADWIGLARITVDREKPTAVPWSQTACAVHGVDSAAALEKFHDLQGSSTAAAAIQWTG